MQHRTAQGELIQNHRRCKLSYLELKIQVNTFYHYAKSAIEGHWINLSPNDEIVNEIIIRLFFGNEDKFYTTA